MHDGFGVLDLAHAAAAAAIRSGLTAAGIVVGDTPPGPRRKQA